MMALPMQRRTILSSGLLPLAATMAWVGPACSAAPAGGATGQVGAPAATTSASATSIAAVSTTSAAPSPATTLTPAAPVPIVTGVLARATTSAGQPIVVEQDRQERRLLIDGVVQGAVRLRPDGGVRFGKLSM